MIDQTISRVQTGEDLDAASMTRVMNAIMQGQASNIQISSLLLALAEKGESVAELAGAARALRQHMQQIRSTRNPLVDTCGTGGGGTGTFNISTAAAITAAAAGVSVAKHGNRKITSKSGSADALAELGVNIEASTETIERCLEELGVCFCFAPLLHPSMKHVAQVRRDLGVRTIFNLLGPLCNPASAGYQVLGVGNPAIREKMAAALAQLGATRAVVICGEDGLGEVTMSGRTLVSEINNGEITETTWEPADFGLHESPREHLLADGPQQSAAIIRDVLAGTAGPPRDITIANAAAAIFVAGRASTLQSAASDAAKAIDSGAASDLLKKLAELSHS